MRMSIQCRRLLWSVCVLTVTVGVPATAAQTTPAVRSTVRTVRVVGVVRDDVNGITLPGVPVEVVGSARTVYSDVDGRWVLDLPPGRHELRVSLDGYQERRLSVDVPAGTRALDLTVGLTMSAFAETVVVKGRASVDAVTASAEAQMLERRQATVIEDNLGAQDMRQNADGDAASAMARVTGVSVVDNQFIFVRGLGERYSNTTLAGATLPTTEPDKKVVPLDLFPTGLLDSVQVSKSYSPDRSAEFAGGLVQITPLRYPSRTVASVSYGYGRNSQSTGRSMPVSPLGIRDWLGYDRGARALPAVFPASKIVRRGIYTPNVGYSPEEITAFGRALENRWRPVETDGAPLQNWGAVFGRRFGRLGIVASASHAYRELFVRERRAFYRIGDGSELEAVSDYDMQYGTERAQLGLVGNAALQFTPNHRIALENFYSHSGRDEGRTFEGPNTENLFYYRNDRLQFIEEGLLANSLTGEHFVRTLASSRIDWRVSVARASRDEPDLRETLYQAPMSASLVPTGNFLLADESQSGFRMFTDLDDRTTDVAANWNLVGAVAGRPTQFKAGTGLIERTRRFSSRRFRFIPNVANTGGQVGVNLSLRPEELFVAANIGPRFRFNEETRPVDAYDGDQTTVAGYAMADVALSARTRVVAGARVERFEQEVTTFDPFGLFVRRLTATNRNTDIFPSINIVQGVGANQNIRLSYSTTVNRPEFRELAAFEFTDVVGSRAVQGNPDLRRALIQNMDARWEWFPGGRSVLAVSGFLKRFDQPIERVVIAGAQPITTFQNADRARNAGLELEAAYDFGRGVFVNANYTFVDSRITLSPSQRTVQTSLERPLAGQSRHVLNLIGEYVFRGFSARVLVNYFDGRISDVGANQAPDVLENGRGTMDVVLSQRLPRRTTIRLSADNLTDAVWRFSQGSETQRRFTIGRTLALSLGIDLF